MQHITVVFNCTRAEALEVLRFIPAEIADAMADSWEDVYKWIEEGN